MKLKSKSESVCEGERAVAYTRLEREDILNFVLIRISRRQSG